jgi:hypothetical protein
MKTEKKRSQNWAVLKAFVVAFVEQLKSYIASYFGVEDFNELVENFPMPSNSVVDFKELPPIFRWYTYIYVMILTQTDILIS